MQFKQKSLSLDKPQIMGILNVTPDSFSDGGQFIHLDDALSQAEQMIADGASFIDIGGESTRPGADEVSIQVELDRVVPVIEAIDKRFDVVISIDTSKAQVMSEAVAAGAGLINDVCALRLEGAVAAAANSGAAVCLMHMQGEPRTMQKSPLYKDVVQDIKDFLNTRMAACLSAGIPKEQLIIDPGFGFGKSLRHNCDLLAGLDTFQSLDVPLLAGVSRKSMFGALLGREVQERLVPSVVAAVIAVQKGAGIVRVHDVRETADALKVLEVSQVQ